VKDESYSLFLVSRYFAGLVQRIFKRYKIQDTPDNVLNILMYRFPFCIITYMRYKLLKLSNYFLANSAYRH